MNTPETFTPKTFKTVAKAVHNNDTIEPVTLDSGFIRTDITSPPIVALKTNANNYILAKPTTRTSTVGRNSRKLQTRQHKSTKVEFRAATIDTDDPDYDTANDAYENAEKIDRGYVNPYRTTPIDDAIDNTFDYYATEA